MCLNKSVSCIKGAARVLGCIVVLALASSGTIFAAAPSNNDFASGLALFGVRGSIAGSNADADKEPLEPNHAGNPGGHSVWFRWHANCRGTMRLDPTGSSIPVLLAVYRGGSPGSLSAVASAVNQAVEFTLIPGAVYHFAVDGQSGAFGDFTLQWQQTFQPGGGPDLVIMTNSIQPHVITRTFAGDDCQVRDGCTLPGTRQLLRFDIEMLNQGREDMVIGSPIGSPLYDYDPCVVNFPYRFSYYATFRLLDGVGQVVASGRKFAFCLEDTQRQLPSAGMDARYGCSSQGIQAGWSDVYGATLACQYVDVTTVPPGQYALEVHINPLNRIVESNSSNNIALVPVFVEAGCSGPPSNDSFANAITLNGAVVTVIGDTRCATKQSGEPSHANNSGGRSIWYRWSAPYSGPVTISLLGSSFDTLVAVYTGTTLASLGSTIVDHNDDFETGILQSQVKFNATSGVVYRITVDGYNGDAGADSGTAMLHINPARNDAFTNALTIAGTNGTLMGYTRPATREPGEPAHAGNPGGHSVWFRWVAPQSGLVTFDTTGSRFDPLLAAYTGATIGSLSLQGEDASPPGLGLSRVTFNVAAGTSYDVAVDGRDNVFGLFRLNWSMSGVLAVVRLGDGSILITVDGVPGENCTLEASTNLIEWEPVATVLNQTGRIQFAPQPASGRARFFRVVATRAQR